MMRWWSSLTVRLVVASLAWTTGLLYVTHLASVFLLFGGAEAMGRFGHSIGLTSVLAIAIMLFGVTNNGLRSSEFWIFLGLVYARGRYGRRRAAAAACGAPASLGPTAQREAS